MAKHGETGTGSAPELGPDQDLDESTDRATGATTWAVRDRPADEIAHRKRQAAIKAFLESDPGTDDLSTAALRAFLELEGR